MGEEKTIKTYSPILQIVPLNSRNKNNKNTKPKYCKKFKIENDKEIKTETKTEDKNQKVNI